MKLFASNYDGTLLYGEDVMKEDLEAIQEWRDAGNLFVIVTGRSKDSIENECKKHNIQADYIITNNGSMVFDAEGKVLNSVYLDYTTGVDIIYAAKMTEGIASLVVNDGIHRHKMIVDPGSYDYEHMHLAPDMTEEEIMNLKEFSQIVITTNNLDNARSLARDLNQFFEQRIRAFVNDNYVDVVAYGTSKATGLEFVAEYENVDFDDIYFMGKSFNDIPLLDYTDNSGVIAVAPDDVKAHCQKEYFSISEMLKEIE